MRFAILLWVAGIILEGFVEVVGDVVQDFRREWKQTARAVKAWQRRRRRKR